MKKAILKQTKKPDITLDIFDEQAGIMKKVTFIGPAIDAYKKPSLSEEELEIVRKYESALKLKAHMDKLKEYREADSKIPDHLKNVLSGDDLSDMEKTAMTKPLSMEDKKNAAKSFKKIGIANDLWDDDWTDLKARLPAMDYVQQHKELSRLLNLIQAHKNAYQLKGVDKVNEAENEITYIINDIQCAHPELSQKENGQSKEKMTKTERKYDASQTLKKIFINDKAYEDIMESLSREGLTDVDSGKWIDRTKGHKSKIIALIHHLGSKRYYKNGVPSIPDPKTIQSIVRNTFGIDIAIDTIKSANRPGNNLGEIQKRDFYMIRTCDLPKIH